MSLILLGTSSYFLINGYLTFQKEKKLREDFNFIENTKIYNNENLKSFDKFKRKSDVNLCLRSTIVSDNNENDILLNTDTLLNIDNYFNKQIKIKDTQVDLEFILYNYNYFIQNNNIFYIIDQNNNKISLDLNNINGIVNLNYIKSEYNSKQINMSLGTKLKVNLTKLFYKDKIELRTGYITKNTYYNLLGVTNGDIFKIKYITKEPKEILLKFLDKKVENLNKKGKASIIFGLGFLVCNNILKKINLN